MVIYVFFCELSVTLAPFKVGLLAIFLLTLVLYILGMNSEWVSRTYIFEFVHLTYGVFFPHTEIFNFLCNSDFIDLDFD